MEQKLLKKIEIWKKSLLDLSRRNPLISFKSPKRTSIRIVDEIPSEIFKQLLIDAEYVTKVNAICMSCGDPASFTQRMSTEKDLVVVGETDKYEARCRKCFKI